MNWQMHLLIGLVFGIALAFFLNLDFFASAQLVLLSSFSALVPDIDHKDSKMRQITNYAAFVFALLFSLSLNFSPAGLALQKIVVDFFAIFGAYSFFMLFVMPPHRGFVHSLSFAFLYAVALFLLFDFQFAIFGAVGFLSHLIADNEIKIF